MIYNAERDEVNVLNATARMVYELFRQGKDAARIEKELRDKFSIPEGCDVRGDIEVCLEELKAKNLIVA